MTRQNTIIIVPSEVEARFFALHGLHAHICGVGMAECAATTAHLLAGLHAAGQQPRLVILAGIAGTCTDTLKTGDTVAVASETIADLGRRNADGSFTPLFQKNYRAGAIPENLASVRSNTVNMAGGVMGEKNVGAAAESAEIENMEGAAFFAVCERFGVPAMEVRTISNRVGQPVDRESLDLAAQNLAAAVAKTLSSCD
jgi:nucleoside phosphorylase